MENATCGPDRENIAERHEPGELENTLHSVSPDTFKAPIATLLESLQESNDVTLHDRIQAYSLFYARIKSCVAILSDATPITCPALQLLQLRAQEITLCVKRDIECVLEDTITAEEDFNRDAGGSVWYPGIVTIDRFRYLQESVAVSHGAIQAVSFFFTFRSLSSLFSVEQVEMLLDSVLAVLLAPTIPTPGESKTRKLALYALTRMQLPAVLIRNKQNELISVIRSILTREAPVSRDKDIIADTLKTLHNLLMQYPFVFLAFATTMYPQILAHSTSEHLPLRLCAACAIASLANAIALTYKVEAPEAVVAEYEKTRSILRRATVKFVQAQEDQRRRATGDGGGAQKLDACCLRPLLYAEIPLNTDTEPGPHLGWAFSLLGSLTVLAGAAAFADTTFLKLVLRCIPYNASIHPWVPLRSLHGFLWRCLIWAFSLTPFMSRPKEMNGIDGWRSILRQRYTEYIQPAQLLEVGPCLVYALLGKDEQPFHDALAKRLPRAADVDRATNILKGLMKHPSNSFFGRGTDVLVRLTSDVGADTSARGRSPWDPTTPLQMRLLDGSLVDAELKHMREITQLSEPFDIRSIRPLCVSEIEDHWDQLLELWVLAARRVFNADHSQELNRKSDILHVWQALLLTHAQLTPSYEHLTSSVDGSLRIVGTVKDFLSWDVASSVKLSSVLDLWMVMKRVFSQTWIQDVAETILHDVLQHNSTYEEDGSQEYLELCTELCLSARSNALSYAAVQDADAREAVRKLWYSIAPSWASRSPATAWESTIGFLSVPWSFATPVGPERIIWSNLFTFTISSAGSTGHSTNAVIEEFSKRVSEATADLLLCLLSYIQFDDADTIPFTLLRLIDDYLRQYPMQSKDIYPAINIIDALSQSISTCSSRSVVLVLKGLQNGICTWIASTPEVVSDDEYNQHIIGFYHNSLDSLYRATDSIRVLQDLEGYLCSPFDNVRGEAAGPLAFKSYWDKISTRIDFHGQELPERLKTSLGAMYDAFGGERPSYLPEDTQTEQSIIPDSQPSATDQSPEIWYRRSTPSTGDILPSSSVQPSTKDKAVTKENSLKHVVSQGNSAVHATSAALSGQEGRSKKPTPHPDMPDMLRDIVPEETPEQPVRHAHPTKRRKLAHNDGSNVFERGDDLQPSATSESGVQQMPSGNEHESGSQIRDSLPSPPLSVEVPFVGVMSPLGAEREEDNIVKHGNYANVNEGDTFVLPGPARRNSPQPEETSPPSRSPPNLDTAHSPPQSRADQQHQVHSDSQAQQGLDLDSNYIQMLRTAHDAMRHQLTHSDVPIDEVFAAQDLVVSMGGMLTEHLKKRVRGDLESGARRRAS